MADADVDGAHIATLNLTLFFRHAPDDHRRLRGSVMPPLYRLKWTKARTTSCTPTPSATACSPKARPTDASAQGRRHPAPQGSGRDELPGATGDHQDPEHRILKQVHIE